MSYPNFQRKYDSESLFSAETFVKYSQSGEKGINFKCPARVIICFQTKIIEYIKAKYNHTLHVTSGETIILHDFNIAVVGKFGIGAPITSIVVEVLRAVGAKEFIIVGTAGSISKTLNIADVVLVERAIRDEGVSHHYLPTTKFINADASLVKEIENHLNVESIDFISGTTWTIDAIYRETKSEVLHYQNEGVLTVEMEAATVFTMAKYWGLKAAAVLVISDDLSDLEWNPQFFSEEVSSSQKRVIDNIISLNQN